MRDMFGNEISIEQARVLLKAKPKPVVRGYAAPPGTGPAGETCKTCQHYRSARLYWRYHFKIYGHPECIWQ